MYILWNDVKFLGIVNKYRKDVYDNKITSVKILPELPNCIESNNRKIMTELVVQETFEFESVIKLESHI